MTTSTIKVLLADDHPGFLMGIKSVLALYPDFEVVFEAKNGFEALAGIQSIKPDVAVLDIEMPEMSGMEVVKQLKSLQNDLPILILSAYCESAYIETLLDLGVNGYLLKNEVVDRIANAIKAVAKGEIGWISPQVNQILFVSQNKVAQKAELSAREQQILSLLKEGKSNQEIANDLCLSYHTIKNNITTIFTKLGYKQRSDVFIK